MESFLWQIESPNSDLLRLRRLMNFPSLHTLQSYAENGATGAKEGSFLAKTL